MRKDKEFIFTLRRQGESYRQIQAKTGVSRATLTKWFGTLEWSEVIKEKQTDIEMRASKERMVRMNMVRKLKLQYGYALMESSAEKEYETFRKEPLFWAGLLAYAGAGDTDSAHQIRISSVLPYIHHTFMQFALKYLGISKETFRHTVVTYTGADSEKEGDRWATALGAERSAFYAPQILEGQTSSKRLRYSTCISIISNTALKKKLLKWLELVQSEEFERS